MTYIEIDREQIEQDKEKLLEFLDEETEACDAYEKVKLLSETRHVLAERSEDDEDDVDYSYFA